MPLNTFANRTSSLPLSELDANFTFVSDSTNLSFLQSGTGAVSRSVQAKERDIVSVKDFGAVGDGTTDDTAAIQAAIDAINATGGGMLLFPDGGNYLHNSAIALKTGVTLIGYGAKLTWGGSTTPQITSATTGVLVRAGIIGLGFNSDDASQVIQLYSPYACVFRDLRVDGNSATSYVINVEANTAGATNEDGNRNPIFNVFDNITQDGVCGTFVRLNGQTSVPITLNTFNNLNALSCQVRGIDFVQWVDNNNFSGITRVSITANNAVGVEYNSGSPTSNVGVYTNNFAHLAVDSFGTYTGRVGVKMNYTKTNVIEYLFQDPIAEGGDFVTTSDTISYRVLLQKGATNDMYLFTKGVIEKGSNETLTASSPIDVSQTWNNGAVNFVGHRVSVTNTASAGTSLPYQARVDGATVWYIDKAGNSVQTGVAGIGQAASTGAVSLTLASGRTGSGFTFINMIGDTTYTDYALRLIRDNGGANTTSRLVHRGTGALQLQAETAGGSVVIQTSGTTTRFSANDTGIGFYATAPVAKPTVTGSRGGNAALADLLTELATLGLITDSSTA